MNRIFLKFKNEYNFEIILFVITYSIIVSDLIIKEQEIEIITENENIFNILLKSNERIIKNFQKDNITLIEIKDEDEIKKIFIFYFVI